MGCITFTIYSFPIYITSVLVITRYQQLGSFNDKNFFLGILEAEKSNIKVETK